MAAPRSRLRRHSRPSTVVADAARQRRRPRRSHPRPRSDSSPTAPASQPTLPFNPVKPRAISGLDAHSRDGEVSWTKGRERPPSAQHPPRHEKGPPDRYRRRLKTPHQLHVLLRHRLLRQPHGFEGFGSVGVLADAIEPAAAQLVNPEDALVDLDSAPLACAPHAYGAKCTVLCRCALDLLRLQRTYPRPQATVPYTGRLPPGRDRRRAPRGRVLHLRVKLYGERAPVALVERGPEPPHRLADFRSPATSPPSIRPGPLEM